MAYRTAQRLTERQLMLRPARLRVTTILIANAMIPGILIAAVVFFDIGSAAALVLLAPLLLVSFFAFVRPFRARTRCRMIGRRLIIERMRGVRVVESHELDVDLETKVEVVRRGDADAVRGYGLVLHSGELRIALDDADDDAMNDPLARQATLTRFLESE